MALSDLDRNLIDRCLQKQPQAWDEFVDRFAGLIAFVVRSTCKARNIALDPNVQADLVQEVFVVMLSDNFVIFRRFRGNCSFATYLTVIARRVIVKSLLQKYLPAADTGISAAEREKAETLPTEDYIDNMDEVLYLISHLPERDAKIVKMYHLEQKTYAEISSIMGIPENTVGPILSRARETMRQKS